MPHADRSRSPRRAEKGGPADIAARAAAAPRPRNRAAVQPGGRPVEVASHATAALALDTHPAAYGATRSCPGRPREAQPRAPDRAPRAGAARAAAAAAQRAHVEVADEPGQVERHPRRGADRARAGKSIRRAGTKAPEPASATRRAESRVGADPRLQHHPRRQKRGHHPLRVGSCGGAEGHDPARIWKARRSHRGGLAVTEDLTYEQAMDKLEETLKRMESDKLSLDEAVKAAEDAQKYFRICVQRLDEARKKIEVRAETEPTA